MNLRTMINRKITYSKVQVKFNDDFWNFDYLVYGKATVKNELKKILKRDDLPVNDIPVITIEVFTERRAIDIGNFINHSIKINDNKNLNNEGEM